MREIKFRAWDKKGLAMSHPFFIGWKQCEVRKSVLDVCNARLIVMQYTGLKDKNGKEIYEGDIIQAGDDVFKILYSNNDFCHVFWLNSQKNYMTLPFLKGIKDFEMIGNIYENPELLEVNSDT